MADEWLMGFTGFCAMVGRTTATVENKVEENRSPIFVALEQSLDVSAWEQVFRPPRLKSQIQGIDSRRGRLPFY